ncbi:putative transcriptional regulator, XRE family protein [Plesiocystis pacifica SIR-1]|uniref:Putative transcriptional regulator, XRE family protein n=2 Tax=Plesiocystis pacifica TaxID=191768 RepID=A6GHU0_9BACT|nr:putative transcriptional regulator, XRE family protein [Plesiocystis pacifica SIR-1]
MPKIKRVMTPFPHSIEGSASPADAQAMMKEHGIRHLPVCEGRNVIGILSERDTRIALRVDEDAHAVSVADICTRKVYTVELDAPLDEVVAHMAEQQIGSAVIMRGDRLAGILTTTDVCDLLARVLREHYVSTDDVVA